MWTLGRSMAPLTYRQLMDEQSSQVALSLLNEQTAANRATALRQFLAANALNIDDVVGDEMRYQHPEAMECFILKLQLDGRSTRSISNTRAAFRPWKEAVIDHDTARATAEASPTPFMEAINSIMRGNPVKRVAKQAAVPPDMLRGWMLGKQPRPSSEKYLARMEVFFGLSKESLISLAGIKPRGFKAQLGGPAVKNPYNDKVVLLAKEQYCLKPSAGSPLRKQWHDLLSYKTSNITELERTQRGKWSLSPCPMMPPTDANWWAFIDGKEVASARFLWHKTSSYLGWLSLDEAQGGKGIPSASVETLAWLAVPVYLEQYLDWCMKRIGERNGGATQFLAGIASLVRPQYGYLAQSPQLKKTLPAEFKGQDWQKLCDRQFRVTRKLVSAFQGEIEVSRDSFAPIREIIQLAQPMDAVVDMIRRMRADRPVTAAPSIQAIWARDLALIKLLVSNPLRGRNLSHLTWRPDNTGDLYQRPDKSWWIRVSKRKFKNRKGAAGDSVYDCEVQESAWKDVERYIFTYRPILMKFPTDLVFLTRLEKGSDGHRPWTGLSPRVYDLSTKYVPRCGGFRAHAVRHIVATSILKAPGGTHKVAARVLNDRVATVERHYDGLTSNDGAYEMGRLLSAQFKRM